MPPQTTALHAQGATLNVDNDAILITKGERTLIMLDAIRFNHLNAEGWNIISENEAEVIVRLTYPAAVDHNKPATDDTPRSVDLTISVINGGFRMYAAPPWGNQTTLEFDHLDDHFFGLSALLQPDNRLSPDLTGTVINVEIDSRGSWFKENYASAYSAFYMSTHGYGAFFDTFARGRYDFGINGRNRIYHETGTLDWYIFIGENGADIHRHYYNVIGAPKKVPMWGLGPIGWRDQNDGGAAEILDDVERMNALEIPFTGWFVDRPYSDGAHAWSVMNFNADFPDPSGFISQLNNYGLEFMTWTSAATFGDARFEKHLAGAFSYIDLSHPPSVEAFQQALVTQQYVHGVKGHKIDRADELVPAHEAWHDTSVHTDARRNTYVYLSAKVHDDILREQWGDDQFTFARAAIHRTQPYLSAIWAGDPRSTWEGMQANFANAARSAFMGFPVWGTDVGGYIGEGYIPEDLYIRWMQAGSMTGFFEIKLDGAGGSGRDRMPWQYGEDLQAAFRSINQDRMRFLPYLYSLATTSETTGTLMQPLAYRHLDDAATYSIWDQFYLGEALLIAPVFTADTNRNVYLPEGTWHDLEDPSVRYEGRQALNLSAPLNKLPRFVRTNSLFVTGNIFSGNAHLWDDQPQHLVIHATPGEEGDVTRFTYVDYLDGDASKEITLRRDEDGIHLEVPPLSTQVTAEIIVDAMSNGLTLNGDGVEVAYDETRKVLRVRWGAGQPASLFVPVAE